MIKSLNIQSFITFIIISIFSIFVIHWIYIKNITTSEKRLKHSRGSYLGFSFIILLSSWFLTLLGGFSMPGVLLSLGYTLSFIGDVFNLQFRCLKKRVGEPQFWGILFFLVAQALYITSFITIIGAERVVSSRLFFIILIPLLALPGLIFRFKVYSAKRPKSIMRIAFIYCFFLGTMTALSLSSAITYGGYWWLIISGAAMFLISDAFMGESTIKGEHPKSEFQIPWITYLAAQGLILFTYMLL